MVRSTPLLRLSRAQATCPAAELYVDLWSEKAHRQKKSLLCKFVGIFIFLGSHVLLENLKSIIFVEIFDALCQLLDRVWHWR